MVLWGGRCAAHLLCLVSIELLCIIMPEKQSNSCLVFYSVTHTFHYSAREICNSGIFFHLSDALINMEHGRLVLTRLLFFSTSM